MKIDEIQKNLPLRLSGMGWQNLILRLTNKGILLLIYVLLFLSPLFLIPRVATYDTVIHLKKLIVDFLVSTIAVLCVIRLIMAPQRISFKKDPVRFLVFVYALLVVVSALLSREKLYSFHRALSLFPLLVLFITIPEILQPRPSTLPGKKPEYSNFQILAKLRFVILFTGALVALYGLCQYFGFDFLKRWFPYDLKEELARNYMLSTLGNPEYLGSYLAPIALLILPGVFGGNNNKIRVIYFLLSLILLASLLLTGARGPLIALFAGAIPVLIFIYKKTAPRMQRRFTAIFIFLCIFVFVFMLVFSFPNPINRHNQAILQRFLNLGNVRSTSMKERILFHTIGAELIAERPVFGVGEGMFRVKFYPTLERLAQKDQGSGVYRFIVELKNRVADNTHNDFLQIWIENGTLGFLVFTLAMSFAMAGAFSQVFKPNLDPERGRLLLGFCAASLCLLVNATFSFPLHMPVRAALFWCVFGAMHYGALTLFKEGSK